MFNIRNRNQTYQGQICPVLLQNFTILKILRTFQERICGVFFFLFFSHLLVFHKQKLDNCENTFYKVEMLKATL